jgi:ferritin-like metal-binding protein YciE
MEQTRQTYLAWLRDAHAMEKQALTMMEGQLSRLENYPQLKARIQTHITETKEQLAGLGRLLSRQASEPSLMKDTMGKLTALGQSFSGMFASDEVVKGTLASYTFEQMEIASYRILITAAEQIGDHQAVEVFTRCLEQEEAMADWLAGHSAEITRSFLSRTELELPAQR